MFRNHHMQVSSNMLLIEKARNSFTRFHTVKPFEADDECWVHSKAAKEAFWYKNLWSIDQIHWVECIQCHYTYPTPYVKLRDVLVQTSVKSNNAGMPFFCIGLLKRNWLVTSDNGSFTSHRIRALGSCHFRSEIRASYCSWMSHQAEINAIQFEAIPLCNLPQVGLWGRDWMQYIDCM